MSWGPRRIMLEQLEERIVLDAAPVALDQHDTADWQDALTAEPMLLDQPSDAAAGAPPAAGAASVPDLLQQVLGQNINDILITNLPGGIESLFHDTCATTSSSGSDSHADSPSQVLVVSSALEESEDQPMTASVYATGGLAEDSQPVAEPFTERGLPDTVIVVDGWSYTGGDTPPRIA